MPALRGYAQRRIGLKARGARRENLHSSIDLFHPCRVAAAHVQAFGLKAAALVR
jgi:hypothetical protein